MNVLITNAHLNYPGWSEGMLNKSMADLAKDYFISQGHEVIQTDIETGYDLDKEVQKHVNADIVILQTPINWFGAPWIYKKYVDEVFNSGLHSKVLLDSDGRTRSDPTRQYGTGGRMQGKKFMVAATWNAPTETFNNTESVLFEGKGTADLLLNITSNYRFIGFEILKDYGIHDIFRDTTDIGAELEGYRKHLAWVVGSSLLY